MSINAPKNLTGLPKDLDNIVISYISPNFEKEKKEYKEVVKRNKTRIFNENKAEILWYIDILYKDLDKDIRRMLLIGWKNGRIRSNDFVISYDQNNFFLKIKHLLEEREICSYVLRELENMFKLVDLDIELTIERDQDYYLRYKINL